MMSKPAARSVIAIVGCLHLVACAGWAEKPAIAPDPADEVISAAALSVSRAWQSSVRQENRLPSSGTTGPGPSIGSSGDVSAAWAALDQRLDMSWFGELLPAVESVGRVIGFDVTQVGIHKGPPILVRLDAIDVPASEILRQAGVQSGDRADVVVDPSMQRIEVVFHD